MKKSISEKKWKLISLLIFAIALANCCRVFAMEKISVYSQRYPDIYLSYSTKHTTSEGLTYNLNNKSIQAKEKSFISNDKLPKNIIVLIDDSSFYPDRSIEGKKNHFLLELCVFFENKPSLPFSYLVNEKISAFELNRENILSLKPSSSKKVRIIDAIILSNNHIMQHNAKEDSLILVVGSGTIKGDMELSFIPQCPIIYLHPANTPINHDFFSFMVKASGGHFLEIPDQLDQQFIQEQLSLSFKDSHHILRFHIPWKWYRLTNHFTLQDHEHLLQATFSLPVSWKINLSLFSGFVLILFVFMIIAVLKKRRKAMHRKKTCHAYMMAFLMISSQNKRYEARISKCEFLIGSSKNCDCTIDDFDLSSTHCMIKEKNDAHEIIDLKSRNGVFVNGRKVEQCYLRHEDVIVVGSSCLIYKLGNMSYVADKKVL